MIRVIDLKKTKIFSDEFINTLPTHCEYCNFELGITETLTKLSCPNIKCKGVKLQRLISICNEIGIKGFDDSFYESLLDEFNTTNPYAVFSYKPVNSSFIHKELSPEDIKIIYSRISKKRQMYLWEFLKIGAIEGLSEYARLLLKDYTDLDLFYEELKEGELVFVSNLIGIKDEDTLSTLALDIYSKLLIYEKELKEGVKGVKIKQTDLPILTLCIDKNIGRPYKNKSEFIKEINELVKNEYNLVLLDYITKDCDYFICTDKSYTTSNYQKAKMYNIVIYNGIEFKEYIQRGAGAE